MAVDSTYILVLSGNGITKPLRVDGYLELEGNEWVASNQSAAEVLDMGDENLRLESPMEWARSITPYSNGYAALRLVTPEDVAPAGE